MDKKTDNIIQAPNNSAEDEKNEIARLQAEIGELRAQLSFSQWQYNEVTNAFFWKITKPFRCILNVLNRNKWVALFNKGLHSLKSFGLKATWAKIKTHQNTTQVIDEAMKAESLVMSRIDTIQELIKRCRAAGGEVFGEELLLNNLAAERMLLVSHELNLTGAPIALQYLAESLQRQGKLPVVIAPQDDALRPLLTEEGIPVLTHPALYPSDFVKDCAPLFSTVIINTIVGAPIAAKLSGSDVPVLWWIHEAHASYHPGMLAEMPETLGDNIHVYSVSDHADKTLKFYRPSYPTGRLMFCLPDYAEAMRTPYDLSGTDGKTVFVLVGTFEERKGQDIFAEAVRLLAPEYREKAMFVFVGANFSVQMMDAVSALQRDYPDHVRYIPVLSRPEIMGLYDRMDCAVCASRDDPVSITIAEAMALSKPVICSENAGISAFLLENDSGLVYRDNDPKALAAAMMRVMDGEDLSAMCQRARQAFEAHFDPKKFDRKTDGLIDQILSAQRMPLNGAVSVVIPTFNAGAEFDPLLRCLKAQRGVGDVELVIVDSGSTDGTVNIARTYGAKVIEIPQAEFSHSHARNLGTEAASGDYVMVMTQDAVPNGMYWLWKMAQPIVKDGVAAVSCREVPKPGCDLTGRLGIYIHSEYMGILDCDRILSDSGEKDFHSLRKNAQLNDVACMFDREIFLKFKYQGNYAEDLDIGLRMIRAGYLLALLSSTWVIHSHTRPAYYYLKRGVVDVSTLKKILPDFPMHTVNSSKCMDQIITAYAAEKKFADDLLRGGVPSEKDGFISWTNAEFERIRSRLKTMLPDDMRRLLEATAPYTDASFQQFVLEFWDRRGENFQVDLADTNDQAHYVTTHAAPFLVRESGAVDECGRRELAAAMEKHAAQLAGNMLAGHLFNHGGEDPYMDELCEELSKGV